MTMRRLQSRRRAARAWWRAGEAVGWLALCTWQLTLRPVSPGAGWWCRSPAARKRCLCKWFTSLDCVVSETDAVVGRCPGVCLCGQVAGCKGRAAGGAVHQHVRRRSGARLCQHHPRLPTTVHSRAITQRAAYRVDDRAGAMADRLFAVRPPVPTPWSRTNSFCSATRRPNHDWYACLGVVLHTVWLCVVASRSYPRSSTSSSCCVCTSSCSACWRTCCSRGTPLSRRPAPCTSRKIRHAARS